MKFYRYEAEQYPETDRDGEYISPKFPHPHLALKEFDLIKETEKGYWIGYAKDSFGLFRKWVSKTAVKRYAYLTKGEALDNFIKRTERRVEILQYQLDFCKYALQSAKTHSTSADG